MDINCFSLSNISSLFGGHRIIDNAFCLPCSDPPANSFQAQVAIKHSLLLGNLSLTIGGLFRLEKLKSYLVDLLEKKEHNRYKSLEIYRIKGLIKVKDHQKLHILQCVHEVFDIQPSYYDLADPEVSEKSLLVIIGHHLDEIFLQEGFESCLD